MLINSQIDRQIDEALTEDLGLGDVTTHALVPEDLQGRANVVSRQAAVVAGLGVFCRVFERIDAGVRLTRNVPEGARIREGEQLVALEGPLTSILLGERVALNFLQRLCGIATTTASYVDALPVNATTLVVDTRKTTPGLRSLERHAVRCGGGANHRSRLDGGVLIKENHIAACGTAGEAVRRARIALGPALRVEVEVTHLDQLDEVVDAGAEVVMLDNMSNEDVRAAVGHLAGRVLVEASGGITVDRIPALAEAGVDFISVGALTHSAPAIDLSLLVEPC